METESGRDGEMEARREMGGGAKEEWRERERDRDRQTDRQRQRDRDRQTDRQTDRDRERWRHLTRCFFHRLYEKEPGSLRHQ